jgi:hypothetical protein
MLAAATNRDVSSQAQVCASTTTDTSSGYFFAWSYACKISYDSTEALKKYAPNLFNRQRYDQDHGISAPDHVFTITKHEDLGQHTPKLELLPLSFQVERQRLLDEKQSSSPVRSASGGYPPNSTYRLHTVIQCNSNSR